MFSRSLHVSYFTGNAACSTCHVYLDEVDYNRLGPPDESEQDMLDLAWGEKPNSSRLGCQFKFDAACEGMTITVPESSNNILEGM